MSIYQLLGGFVFFFSIIWCFCDQSDDDIVEAIWVYWREFANQNKWCFHPQVDISKLGVVLLGPGHCPRRVQDGVRPRAEEEGRRDVGPPREWLRLVERGH